MTSAGCGCGCGCAATGASICPCEDVHGPWWPYNPSGLPQLSYRVGDFGAFRHELLRHRSDEQVLTAWRPSAQGDLGLQVIDWFAIVADILTFYTERIANEAYLGTAVLPDSVQRLVALLGYRPRPGIGALATLAVIASKAGPVILPDRFQLSSKAQPGIDSQTFELTTGTTFNSPTSVPVAPPDDLDTVPTLTGPPPDSPPGAAEVPAHKQLFVRGGVLVKGRPSGLRVGDWLLLEPDGWSGADGSAAVLQITGFVLERDPHRRPNTRILLTTPPAGLAGAQAGSYHLKRATRLNHLVTVPSGSSPFSGSSVYLDATARWLKPNDPLLFSDGTNVELAQLNKYSETVWYANGSNDTPPKPPSGSTTPIPLIVADLDVTVQGGGSLSSTYTDVSAVTIESGWSDVGTLLDTPVSQLAGLPSKLTLARAPAASAGVATTTLVQDSAGAGAAVTATPTPGGADVTIAAADGNPIPDLAPPLQILWDLITVTRGKSVRGEQLGLGDATLPGQDFTLAKQPVTYLADGAPGSPGASRSGDGYSSTIELIVDGRYWTEVPTLYGHRPDELIFATYEDSAARTHVVTGDGETGARLRTGAVVTANYRIESGALTPPAGSLTQVNTPAFNLSAVKNPVPAGGGADPDPPAQLRTYAPRSVLIFGRAVSGDDYEAVAALAPGVTRAKAVWSWDPDEQRALVVVYVGDDSAAVDSARSALRDQADPNRPIVVRAATQVDIALDLTLEIDPSYVAIDVVSGVRSALLEGLFAPGVLGISENLYRSRIEAACQAPGVLAVHGLAVSYTFGWLVVWELTGSGPRFSPGEGGFFHLADADLTVEVQQG